MAEDLRPVDVSVVQAFFRALTDAQLAVWLTLAANEAERRKADKE